MTAEAEQQHTEIRVGEIVEGGSPVGAAVLRLIAAAERGGYKRAIAALRDDEGWERWFIQALGEDDGAFTARDNQNVANYLESLTTEGTKP